MNRKIAIIAIVIFCMLNGVLFYGVGVQKATDLYTMVSNNIGITSNGDSNKTSSEHQQIGGSEESNGTDKESEENADETRDEINSSETLKKENKQRNSTNSNQNSGGANSSNTSSKPKPPSVNQPPRLSGNSYLEITQGEVFDPKSQVQASDPESGILPSNNISVSGRYNTNSPGTYSISMSATDDKGAVSNVHVLTLVVKEITLALTENTYIYGGSLYVYNGQVKRAQKDFTFYKDYSLWNNSAYFK
ncbi:MAG: immunoglobulin-like domain-containing protein [Mycoplasmatales bacterium]